MKPRIRQLVASLLLGLALTLGLVGLLAALDTEALGLLVARADPGDIYCVALGGGAYSDCDQVFTSVQAALDAASGGEEIRVASGTYTDLHVRAGVTQVVYVDKTVTIRGGYATTDWNTPDPTARPTTLDAQGQGRVLYITGNLTATIEGLRITNGDADGLLGDPSGFDAGGGVYVYAATVNLSNNQIFSNTAVTGGGLYALEGEDMALNGNTIISNTVYHSGGGLTLRDSPGPTLINNTISFNKATHRGDGGTKHHGGVYFLSSEGALLINNTINGNTASDTCGGITFQSGGQRATLIGNHLINNHAGSQGFGSGSHGGGLCFESSSGANLISNIVISNSTYGNGGGLHLQMSSITMTNNLVADNQVILDSSFTGSGSGLYIAGSSPQLLHTTIARNSGGDGIGVRIIDVFGEFSTVGMTNTILVSHEVGIHVATGNAASLEGTMWGSGAWANTVDTSGDGTIVTGTMNVNGDPGFVDPANSDYHITAGSAAIDGGIDAGVRTDIDNGPRPMDGDRDGVALPDIGADELGWPLYLPVLFKNAT